MKNWLFVWTLLMPLGLGGRPGTVETRGGKAFAGQVRLDTNLVVVANAERALLVGVPSRDLREIVFGAPEAAVALGEGAPPSSGQLPRPWTSQSIGTSAAFAGTATWTADLFRLRSEGKSLGGRRDAFHFVYKPVSGESELVARLLGCAPASAGVKAGLTMRESLDPEAKTVTLAVTGTRGGALQWRTGAGQDTIVSARPDLNAPVWLKLKRDGENFFAYRSGDGRSWRLLDRVTARLADDLFVGLVVCGADGGPAGRAIFDNLREGTYLPNTWFTPRVELRSGSTVAGRIAALDGTHVHFAGPLPQGSLPLRQVTRIFFRWLPFGLTTKVEAGRPGVLLTTGEFIDGELRGMDKGRIELSSVLFGLRRFDANSEVIAVVLGKAARQQQDWAVKTVQGSLWQANSVEIGRNEVAVHDAALGRWIIPIHELAEMRWR